VTKHHKSETDLLRQEDDFGRNADSLRVRSESTTKLPSKKPTTIGSTEDILAHSVEEDTEEEIAAKAAKKAIDTDRFRKMFDQGSSGPKSLPQSMTTTHQGHD
jgi:hypothetical protein